MKNVAQFILICLVIAPCIAADKPIPDHLSLQVRIMNGDPTVLNFHAANVGKTEVRRGSLGMNTNKIWVLCPDASVELYYGIIDTFQAPQMLKPGEEVDWEKSVKSLIARSQYGGEYRVSWQFGEFKSNEVRVQMPGRAAKGEHLKEVLKRFHMICSGHGQRNELVSISYDPAQPAQVDAVRVIAARASHARRFMEAVDERWGANARTAGGGWFFEWFDEPTSRAIDEGVIEIPEHFETATLQPKDWETRFRFARDGTEWKVSVENFMLDGTIRPRIAEINEILEEERERIEKGEHATIRDAREAMRKRCWPGATKKPAK